MLRKVNRSLNFKQCHRRLVLIAAVTMLSLASAPLYAIEKVVALGLFTGKAVIEVDGTRRVLSVGQVSKEGIELISSDSDTGAVLRIDGKMVTLQLNSQIGATYSKPALPKVSIVADSGGMFRTSGKINRATVTFLVDTGASIIALNANTADRIGIRFRDSVTHKVETASGVVDAFPVVLDKVSVGGVMLRNVNATVLEGEQPTDVLLGQSFLGKLRMKREGRLLLLEKRW